MKIFTFSSDKPLKSVLYISQFEQLPPFLPLFKRVMVVFKILNGGWQVLPIMNYLSTDILIDLWLLAIRMLPIRKYCHIWAKWIPVEHELDVDPSMDVDP